MKNGPEVVAIYFPNYHRYPHNDAYYGEGWTEWELVRNAPPRFAGHHQPKVPLWGYYDESDPAWAAREIDCAADHGITCFLVDWYWYSGVQIMQRQLEKGFLQAKNRSRLKFALMWANHPWTNFFPVDAGKTAEEMNRWLPIRHSVTDMERVADYCIEHYFREPNYWRIGGQPYFSFFSFDALEKSLGGVAGIRRALERFDARVRAAGLPGMHFNVNIANVNVTVLCWDVTLIARAREAGFHSVFGYNITRTPGFTALKTDRPIVEYVEQIASHEDIWDQCEGRGLPYFPTVTMGCDCSPRWHSSVRFPVPKIEYPYEPIVVNNTPERYGGLCRKAVRYLRRSRSQPKVLFLNAWNEWTEGNYICPEQRYGDGYLKALQQALT